MSHIWDSANWTPFERHVAATVRAQLDVLEAAAERFGGIEQGLEALIALSASRT